MHRFLPAPPVSSVHLSFVTIHFYAVAILLGIISAIAITKVFYLSRGGHESDLYELAARLVPTGIVGGRIYHLITSPDAYFGKHGHPLSALKIWEGGMGIWGAVALGALVAYLYFVRRKRQAEFPIFADALVPGLLIAQAIGRWGNWFNNELFGKPSTVPWALRVPVEFRPNGFENFSTFHPTFLYESLWCLLGAFVMWKMSRALQLQPGVLFIAYIAYYSFGRLLIESIRIDPAHVVAGLRVNIWVSLLGFCVASYVLMRKTKSAR
jgi:prolipoprotein diacylglyceryl transferase